MESDRDRLIKTGVLTPFDRLEGFERRVLVAPEGRLPVATGPPGAQRGGSILDLAEIADVSRKTSEKRVSTR